MKTVFISVRITSSSYSLINISSIALIEPHRLGDESSDYGSKIYFTNGNIEPVICYEKIADINNAIFKLQE